LFFDIFEKVLDKKTQYSNRAGGAMSVEYIYSETEFVDDTKITKWQEINDEWAPVELEF